MAIMTTDEQKPKPKERITVHLPAELREQISARAKEARQPCRFGRAGVRGLHHEEGSNEMTTKAFFVLPPHEQENWQLMEYWSYANDGTNWSQLWYEGEWGGVLNSLA